MRMRLICILFPRNNYELHAGVIGFAEHSPFNLKIENWPLAFFGKRIPRVQEFAFAAQTVGKPFGCALFRVKP